MTSPVNIRRVAVEIDDNENIGEQLRLVYDWYFEFNYDYYCLQNISLFWNKNCCRLDGVSCAQQSRGWEHVVLGPCDPLPIEQIPFCKKLHHAVQSTQ